MKKEYSTPTSKVVELRPHAMLNGSDPEAPIDPKPTPSPNSLELLDER